MRAIQLQTHKSGLHCLFTCFRALPVFVFVSSFLTVSFFGVVFFALVSSSDPSSNANSSSRGSRIAGSGNNISVLFGSRQR